MGARTFTVTRKSRQGADLMSAKYVLTCEQLPGQSFGPYGVRDLNDELYVAALVSRAEARGLIFDAEIHGSVTFTADDGIVISNNRQDGGAASVEGD
jgi:hypothetical protein